MSARYSDQEGALKFKLILESNPQFDSGVSQTLMTTILNQREAFNANQKVLIELKAQHDMLLQMFPGNLYLSWLGRIPIELDEM